MASVIAIIITIIASLVLESYAYKKGPSKVTFTNADTQCNTEYGTDLASIHSYSDFEEAVDVCGTEAPCYLGGQGTQNGNTVDW
eukprot:CAMPEP_0201567592 /NCGR_PEP_ID=MMETSP0190_2-20130828/8153_1 /ASSEMBLY_ACC=CAM_ASM_000263 /TAXON_ID=37353 /ORGANISM="Rosalina sp." /LENGTH=83 /DNA_ID=CAMNT_0047987761 /DNA_START=25 /DNA_END=273 /DNA_ORIENTATION=-